MIKNLLFIFICFSLTVTLACSAAPTPNTNVSSVNAANLDPSNLPPGFSTNPVTMGTNSTPGIPNPNDANANKIPTGNIPGIPDTNKMGKTPQPKNTPPIPGIPDQETIKRQMNTPLKDANIVNNPPKTTTNANNSPAEKPRGNTRQP